MSSQACKGASQLKLHLDHAQPEVSPYALCITFVICLVQDSSQHAQQQFDRILKAVSIMPVQQS